MILEGNANLWNCLTLIKVVKATIIYFIWRSIQMSSKLKDSGKIYLWEGYIGGYRSTFKFTMESKKLLLVWYRVVYLWVEHCNLNETIIYALPRAKRFDVLWIRLWIWKYLRLWLAVLKVNWKLCILWILFFISSISF